MEPLSEGAQRRGAGGVQTRGQPGRGRAAVVTLAVVAEAGR